jgi:hypothetical protein
MKRLGMALFWFPALPPPKPAPQARGRLPRRPPRVRHGSGLPPFRAQPPPPGPPVDFRARFPQLTLARTPRRGRAPRRAAGALSLAIPLRRIRASRAGGRLRSRSICSTRARHRETRPPSRVRGPGARYGRAPTRTPPASQSRPSPYVGPRVGDLRRRRPQTGLPSGGRGARARGQLGQIARARRSNLPSRRPPLCVIFGRAPLGIGGTSNQ